MGDWGLVTKLWGEGVGVVKVFQHTTHPLPCPVILSLALSLLSATTAKCYPFRCLPHWLRNCQLCRFIIICMLFIEPPQHVGMWFMAIYSDELLCDCHDVVVSSKIIQVLGDWKLTARQTKCRVCTLSVTYHLPTCLDVRELVVFKTSFDIIYSWCNSQCMWGKQGGHVVLDNPW